MGDLHEGHRSLIRAARAGCDHVVVSIFVNPTQFGPNEDFDRYPARLRRTWPPAGPKGRDCVFMPGGLGDVSAGAVTTVDVARLTEGLCGASRPGTFRASPPSWPSCSTWSSRTSPISARRTTSRPPCIEQMVRDLIYPIEIVVCPTVREPDGLAMSSRNAYLNPEHRRQAPVLYAALTWARDRSPRGTREMPQADPADARADRSRRALSDRLRRSSTIPRRSTRADDRRTVRAGPGGHRQTRLIDNVLVDAAALLRP